MNKPERSCDSCSRRYSKCDMDKCCKFNYKNWQPKEPIPQEVNADAIIKQAIVTGVAAMQNRKLVEINMPKPNRTCGNCYLFEKCDLSEVTNISCEQYKPKEPQEVGAINRELYDEVQWLRSSFNQHGIDENCLIKIAKEIIDLKKRIRNRAIDEMVRELNKLLFERDKYSCGARIYKSDIEQIAERLKEGKK